MKLQLHDRHWKRRGCIKVVLEKRNTPRVLGCNKSQANLTYTHPSKQGPVSPSLLYNLPKIMAPVHLGLRNNLVALCALFCYLLQWSMFVSLFGQQSSQVANYFTFIFLKILQSFYISSFHFSNGPNERGITPYSILQIRKQSPIKLNKLANIFMYLMIAALESPSFYYANADSITMECQKYIILLTFHL